MAINLATYVLCLTYIIKVVLVLQTADSTFTCCVDTTTCKSWVRSLYFDKQIIENLLEMLVISQ